MWSQISAAAVVGPADIDHDRGVRADRVADALDVGAVRLLGLAEVLPAELEGGEARLLEAGRLLAGLDAVRPEEGGGVGADLGVGRAAQEVAERAAERLALDVPEGDVDAADGVDHRAAAAIVDRGLVHLVPEALDVERVLADQDLAQADHDRVGAGRLDDRLDDGRGGVGLADAGDALVGVDEDDGGVLGPVRLHRDARDLQVGDLDIGDLHAVNPPVTRET